MAKAAILGVVPPLVHPEDEAVDLVLARLRHLCDAVKDRFDDVIHARVWDGVFGESLDNMQLYWVYVRQMKAVVDALLAALKQDDEHLEAFFADEVKVPHYYRGLTPLYRYVLQGNARPLTRHVQLTTYSVANLAGDMPGICTLFPILRCPPKAAYVSEWNGVLGELNEPELVEKVREYVRAEVNPPLPAPSA